MDKNMVRVRPVRTFIDAEHGAKTKRSGAYEVSRQRAAELVANGLVVEEKTGEAEKSAPAPDNKMARPGRNRMAPEHGNKAG